MKKYKFILTVVDNGDNEYEIDSAEDIEGHVVWPSWSQADPYTYRGIFDSYNEAKEYAEKFKLYKYIIRDGGWDSFEDEDDWLECGRGFYLSREDASEAAAQFCGESDEGPSTLSLDDIDKIKVKKITGKEGIPEGSYKFVIIFRGKVVFDSIEEQGSYYDNEDDALEGAKETLEDGEVCDYDSYVIKNIEIAKREVVEFESN